MGKPTSSQIELALSIVSGRRMKRLDAEPPTPEELELLGWTLGHWPLRAQIQEMAETILRDALLHGTGTP